MTAPIVSDQIRAVVVNTGSERMSSPTVARLVSRVSELLPTVPVAVLSDYEDSENIREAFELGVRGYIPTSLASMVAVGAVHLVCARRYVRARGRPAVPRERPSAGFGGQSR